MTNEHETSADPEDREPTSPTADAPSDVLPDPVTDGDREALRSNERGELESDGDESEPSTSSGVSDADVPIADRLSQPVERVIEALLFASEGPQSIPDIVDVFARSGYEGVRPDEVQNGLLALRERLDEGGSAISLVRVSNGWELRTRASYAPWVSQLYEKKPVRLTRASLEVLAIVAYRQPCTRAVVDDIRGVDSSSTLRQMLKLSLLKILGRADDVGRPIVYGTSDEFLRVFGLESLSELPTLREFAELSEEHMLTLAEFEAGRSEADAAAEGDEKPAIDASYRGISLEDEEKGDEE